VTVPSRIIGFPLHGLLHVDHKARVLRFADLIDPVEYHRDTEVVARNL